jgi:hypothetical protein
MSKTPSKNGGGQAAGQPRRPTRVAREPEWVAWTNDGSRILAKGATLEAARDAARALGEPDPILEPAQIRARLA